MSLMSCASRASTWKGYHYFLEHKVKMVQKINDSQYDGAVSGSNGEVYSVHIDLVHPRKSSCNCPHAAGRRIICKHMIALFFTVYPLEAERYIEEVIDYEREAERQEEEAERLAEEEEDKVLSFVDGLDRAEMREILLRLLFEGPEWQWERFIREYIP